ncbi:MAG: MarR family winged helix-turn-helix transcriptional regulator [Lachnospiraceae bacterium]
MEHRDVEKRLNGIMHRIRRMHPDFSLEGISNFEYMLLCSIGRLKPGVGEEQSPKPEDVAYVKCLAKDLEVAPPAVSRSLKTLETKGYIIRSTDAADRRNTVVKLTADGYGVYQRIAAYMEKHMQIIIERYGRERMVQMMDQLEEFLDVIDDEMKRMKEEKKNEADI